MMIQRIWPKSLIARVVLSVIGFSLLVECGNLYWFSVEMEHYYDEYTDYENLGEVKHSLARIQAASSDDRDHVVDSLSNEWFFFVISDQDLPRVKTEGEPWFEEFEAKLSWVLGQNIALQSLIDLTDHQHLSQSEAMEWFGSEWEYMVVTSIQLSDDEWIYLVFYDDKGLDTHDFTIDLTFQMILSSILVLGIAALLHHQMVPLRSLADAAERLGRGEKMAALPERGPREIVKATHAFNQMNLRIERHVEAKTRMLAAMSHDLRTPLTGMRIQAEFIKDSKVRDKIIQGLEEMQTISEASLMYARDDASIVDAELVDISALVDSVCEDFMVQDINLHWEKTEYKILHCSVIAVRRCLNNLIQNAIKYGGNQLAVSAKVDSTLGLYCIYIDDWGPGLSDENRDKAFEPFQRIEASRNPDTGGTGLGLSISRSLARAHGGDIILENRYEKNTCLGLRAILMLPLNSQVS